MHRLLILLLLTLVLATVGCRPAGRPPEIARQAPPVAEETVAQAEAMPTAAKAGSAPAPALVLIGPDTAP